MPSCVGQRCFGLVRLHQGDGEWMCAQMGETGGWANWKMDGDREWMNRPCVRVENASCFSFSFPPFPIEASQSLEVEITWEGDVFQSPCVNRCVFCECVSSFFSKPLFQQLKNFSHNISSSPRPPELLTWVRSRTKTFERKAKGWLPYEAIVRQYSGTLLVHERNTHCHSSQILCNKYEMIRIMIIFFWRYSNRNTSSLPKRKDNHSHTV